MSPSSWKILLKLSTLCKTQDQGTRKQCFKSSHCSSIHPPCGGDRRSAKMSAVGPGHADDDLEALLDAHGEEDHPEGQGQGQEDEGQPLADPPPAAAALMPPSAASSSPPSSASSSQYLSMAEADKAPDVPEDDALSRASSPSSLVGDEASSSSCPSSGEDDEEDEDEDDLGCVVGDAAEELNSRDAQSTDVVPADNAGAGGNRAATRRQPRRRLGVLASMRRSGRRLLHPVLLPAVARGLIRLSSVEDAEAAAAAAAACAAEVREGYEDNTDILSMTIRRQMWHLSDM